MPNTPPRLVAGGTIYPARFIKLSDTEDTTALQASANSKIIGVSRDETRYPPLNDLVSDNPHAIDGDKIGFLGRGEVGLLELGDTVEAGDYLKADADGKGVKILESGTTLQRYGAEALQAGSSGNKILVQVVTGSERPAIA